MDYDPFKTPTSEADAGTETSAMEASVLDKALAFGLQHYRKQGTLEECLGKC